MNCPSGDQLVAYMSTSEARISCSIPAPLEAFSQSSKWPFRFDDENTIRLPSGDHTGYLWNAASNVKRVGRSRATSKSQTPAWAPVLLTAAFAPFGERLTLP